jgi:hypothetical protein
VVWVRGLADSCVNRAPNIWVTQLPLDFTHFTQPESPSGSRPVYILLASTLSTLKRIYPIEVSSTPHPSRKPEQISQRSIFPVFLMSGTSRVRHGLMSGSIRIPRLSHPTRMKGRQSTHIALSRLASRALPLGNNMRTHSAQPDGISVQEEQQLNPLITIAYVTSLLIAAWTKCRHSVMGATGSGKTSVSTLIPTDRVN